MLVISTDDLHLSMNICICSFSILHDSMLEAEAADLGELQLPQTLRRKPAPSRLLDRLPGRDLLDAETDPHRRVGTPCQVPRNLLHHQFHRFESSLRRFVLSVSHADQPFAKATQQLLRAVLTGWQACAQHAAEAPSGRRTRQGRGVLSRSKADQFFRQ